MNVVYLDCITVARHMFLTASTAVVSSVAECFCHVLRMFEISSAFEFECGCTCNSNSLSCCLRGILGNGHEEVLRSKTKSSSSR